MSIILATPAERVKLLRAGLTGKQIEDVFIALNGYSIVGAVLFTPPGQITSARSDKNEVSEV